MKTLLQILLVFFFASVNITLADHIDRYDSDITVLEDGTIDVVESIQLSTQHEEIKLGITRDIPTHYYFLSKQIRTPIKILSVTRNGKPENFWTENRDGYVEIFTGLVDNVVDNYLDKGKHTFIIHWQSQNHIRSFENYDELYINAIGHNWRLPIHKAQVNLHLPESVKAIQSSAYYGIYGQKKLAAVHAQSGQNISFTVPNWLQYGEGLTIATGFTKGILPSIQADQKDIWMDKILSYFPEFIQPLHVVLWAAMIVMLLYITIGWIFKTRLMPKSRRAFMVRYSPPDNINLDKSFALVNANTKDSRVDVAVAALLVDLHAKNYIHIDQDNQQLTVNTELNSNEQTLTDAQKVLLERLQSSKSTTFSFAKANPDLAKAVNGMRNILSHLLSSYCGRYFQKYLISGYLLSIVMIGISTIYLPLEAYMALLFMVIASIKLIVPTLLNYISKVEDKDEDALIGIFPVLAGLVFGAIPLYGMLGDITDFPLSEMGFLAFYGIAMLPIMIIVFCLLLMNSWTYGLKKEYVDDQQAILEFKHFLAYTKEAEYSLITPELFEEYLPYAIIFGVDKNWLKLYSELYPVQCNESYLYGSAGFYNAATNSSFANGLASQSTSQHSHENVRGGFGNDRGSGGSGSGGGGSSGGGSGGGGGGGR